MGFSWPRVWMTSVTESTRLLEILLGVFFFLLRGAFLVLFGYTYGPVEVFLASVQLNEGRLGVLCLIVGCFHVYGAGTNRPTLRAVVAGAGLMLSVVVIVAFNSAGPEWHPVTMVWISVLATEFYIVVRHFITQEEHRRRDAD